MDEIRRRLNWLQSLIDKRKNLRNEFDPSKTCLENLSNELLCEIFDNLEGCNLYQAFSNLNSRFQQLLSSSLVQFHIRPYIHTALSMSNTINNIYQRLALTHKHQIVSIHMFTSTLNSQLIVNSIRIDSSLTGLKSIVLRNIQADILISFLIHFISLPRLSSLTIELYDNLVNLNHVYQLIFVLPQLKYNKLILSGKKRSISLPLATNQQLTTITSLIINHSFTFSELAILISYTPELSRLHYRHTYENDTTIGMMLAITLGKLRYLSIDISSIKFDDFQIFIRKIHSKLRVLSVKISSGDMTFLHAYRWEQFILQDLPQLEHLSFQYHDNINNDYQYLEEFNQFSSSFWIRRQWIFDVEITDQTIVYFLRLYKKRWYDYAHEKMNNSSIDLFKSNRLMLNNIHPDLIVEPPIMNIRRALTLVQIYHLTILEENIFINKLIEIIKSLPNLISIKMDSLSLARSKDLSETIDDVRYSSKNINKITKLYIDNVTEMEEVFSLMKLCPYMAYLKIDCFDEIDEEFFLEEILKKISYECNDQLRFLCFRVLPADDRTIKKFEKLIHSKKLLLDYTIQHVFNQIYLQWK